MAVGLMPEAEICQIFVLCSHVTITLWHHGYKQNSGRQRWSRAMCCSLPVAAGVRRYAACMSGRMLLCALSCLRSLLLYVLVMRPAVAFVSHEPVPGVASVISLSCIL